MLDQEAIFNKGFGIELIFVETTYKLCLILQISLKNSVKDEPMNNYELLNIQAWSFHVVWNRDCAQSLVASCKCWVVPLVSTRVSGYSQVIIFWQTIAADRLSCNFEPFLSDCSVWVKVTAVKKIWYALNIGHVHVSLSVLMYSWQYINISFNDFI